MTKVVEATTMALRGFGDDDSDSNSGSNHDDDDDNNNGNGDNGKRQQRQRWQGCGGTNNNQQVVCGRKNTREVKMFFWRGSYDFFVCGVLKPKKKVVCTTLCMTYVVEIRQKTPPI